MTETMFDGFDHSQYREEVEQRWGKDAYARSDTWYSTMSERERQSWKVVSEQLAEDWIAAATAADISADSPTAHDLAQRHISWLRSIPGVPDGDFVGYVRGLAELYVEDERFAASYGGVEGASFVRDALVVYLERTS